MARRTISTRLIVENEKEYRQAMYNVAQELRQVATELDLVRSKWSGQRNTLQALVAEHEALVNKQTVLKNKLTEQRGAVEKASELQKKYGEALKDAQAAYDDYIEAHKGETLDPNKVDKLSNAVSRYSNAYQKATNDINKWTAEANKTEIALNKVNGEILNNEHYLAEAENAWDNNAKSIDENGKAIDRTSKSLEEMTSVLISKGIKMTFEELLELLKQCITAANEFESAITGVAKTTDFSDEELAVFSDRLQDLATRIPITTTELAGIAETAGQLGIADKDILEFTEVMANLGVSTSMSASEAATALAQLAAITGMAGEDYDRLGSAIVALGNNFATTESNIADLSQNIAASAVNAEMSEKAILGIAAAVTSLGIRADAGGSSVSRLIQQMQDAVVTGDGLSAWAQVAGMSANQFAAAWRDDAAGALLSFIQGLGQLGEEMTPTLRELGISEIRITRVVQSLANAERESQTLSKALGLASQAWRENNALTIEAEKRYATTASKIQLLKNAANNLAISVGKDLNPLIEAGAELGTGVLGVLESINETVPVITLLGAALITLTVAMGIATGSMVLQTAVAKKLVGELKQLTLAMLKNPWTLAATAIVTGIVLVTEFISKLDEEGEAHKRLIETVREEREELAKASEEAESLADSYVGEAEALENLVQKEDKTVADKQTILKLVEQLNESVPTLNIAYDEQADKLYNLATGTEVATEAIIALAREAGKQKYFESLTNELAGLYAAEARLTAQRELLLQDTEIGDIALTVKDSQLYGQLLETQNRIAEITAELDYFGETSEESADSTVTALEDITNAYLENRTAIAEELRSQIKLFDEMETEVNVTFEDMKEALQSQIEWQTNYSAAVQKLRESEIAGMDQLVQKIINTYGPASQEAYSYIMQLSTADEKEVEELMNLIDESMGGHEQLVDTLATGATEVDDTVNEIVAAMDQADTMRALGYSSGAAWINGWKEAFGLFDPLQKGVAAYRPDGSHAGVRYHAQGIGYVPKDDYLALLHEGEMVLNRAEARAYRETERVATSVTNANKTVVNIYPQNLSEAQIDYLFHRFNSRLGGAIS